MKRLLSLLFLGLLFQSLLRAADPPAANRLAYLEGNDPFYPGRDFPKLITPQWVGEPGVDAVVILAIDDMRATTNYEVYLRPILNRLKQIDGRAPVSIMTCTYGPRDLPRLAGWLKEGLSLEVHTPGHPCPLCQGGNFASATTNFFGGIDLLARIPGNHPVAFRMPCCDSMNSPSPRFYSELFNAVTPAGNFLQIDSSVMNVITTNDTALPRNLVLDDFGRDRFRKYLPSAQSPGTKVGMGSFVTTVQDYPYPYVIDRECWEFPCALPSDWEAFNIRQPASPGLLADWIAALDAAVVKQGVFPLVFHPHGWSQPEQLVQLIDHAQKKYGKRVKFLTFREALERLNRNLLAGHPLRGEGGRWSGVRVLDLNHDGYMDVLGPATRIWDPRNHAWIEQPESASAPPTPASETSVFGVFREDASTTQLDPAGTSARSFVADHWQDDPAALKGFAEESRQFFGGAPPSPRAVQMRDVDACGHCELILSKPGDSRILKWDEPSKTWKPLPFALPPGLSLVDAQGRDSGVRFVDVNGDGFDDVIQSDEHGFSLWIYINRPKEYFGWKKGWSFKARSGKRGDRNEIPMITRGGAHPDNGVWFKNGVMWVQNEDTASLPDKVDRRSFKDLMLGDEAAPRSVPEALATFQLRPGFTIECAASEPLIVDPVAFDWSPDGRLWVVEMNDYPLGNGGKGGRVKVLEDTDGDGRYDKATVFLDHLHFPNGIMCWGKGVLISAAPDIIYAAGNDGDGKADETHVLFTGFHEGNQQHRVNGFDYGLDGWIYAANGDSGGVIRSLKTGKTFDTSGHDVRFRPDTGELELIEGQTQFGRHRDDWGHWFGNNNPTWLWIYSFSERYAKRNPFLAVKSMRKVLANYPQSNRIFTIAKQQYRYNNPDAVNEVTSANSATPYRDDLFGADFAASVFASDPANNVVHREVLEGDGVSFTSHRAPDEASLEFLASTDNWFRPTMSRTGPDGALYVADMYRMVIEHPEYFPEELKNRPDLRAGDDKGRIYRIRPKDTAPRKVPRLDQMNTAQLVAVLESPNGWQRDTAQRLLVERRDAAAAAPLQTLVRTSPQPKTKVQALWTLALLHSLSPEVLVSAVSDSDYRVRIQGLIVAESFPQLYSRTDPAARALVAAIAARVDDPNIAVRYQAALSWGEHDGADAAGLAAILKRDYQNPQIQNAVLSSAAPHAKELLTAFDQPDWRDKPELAPVLANLRRLATNGLAAVAAYRVTHRTNSASAAERLARQQTVQRYGVVATLTGDKTHGAALFRQTCTPCHRFQNEGNQLGPDLGSIADKPVAELVNSILNPNAAVDPAYFATTVTMKDGRELSGIIASETSNGLTVRQAGGLEEVVLRADIQELSRSDMSLMPEGLESALKPQDVADLIAFLKSRP